MNQEINLLRKEVELIDAELHGNRKESQPVVKFEYAPKSAAQKLFMTLEDPTYSLCAKAISTFIMILIVTGSVTQIMESMEEFQFIPKKCNKSRPTAHSCKRKPFREFYVVEAICIVAFTIEYMLRMCLVHTVPVAAWLPQIKRQRSASEPTQVEQEEKKEAAVTQAPTSHPNSSSRRSTVRDAMAMAPMALHRDSGIMHDLTKVPATAAQRTCARWRYFTQTMNLIDAVAIFPFWLEFSGLMRSRFGVIRIIRLTRFLRMLKSPSVSNSVTLFYASFAASVPALSILFFFSILAIILVGTLGYIFEQGEFTADEPTLCCSQDTSKCIGCYLRRKSDGIGKEPSPFTSIPRGMYWVVITITTVGYGDLYPTSTGGRLLAILVTYSGVLALALPISVIGNNFTALYERSRLEQKRRELRVVRTKRKASSKMADVYRQARNRPSASVRRSPSQNKFNPFYFIRSQSQATYDDGDDCNSIIRVKRASPSDDEQQQRAALRIAKTFKRRKAERGHRDVQVDKVHPVTRLSDLEEKIVFSSNTDNETTLECVSQRYLGDIPGESDPVGNESIFLRQSDQTSSRTHSEGSSQSSSADIVTAKALASCSLTSSMGTASDLVRPMNEQRKLPHAFDLPTNTCAVSTDSYRNDSLSAESVVLLGTMIASMRESITAQQRTLALLENQLRLASRTINEEGAPAPHM